MDHCSPGGFLRLHGAVGFTAPPLEGGNRALECDGVVVQVLCSITGEGLVEVEGVTTVVQEEGVVYCCEAQERELIILSPTYGNSNGNKK